MPSVVQKQRQKINFLELCFLDLEDRVVELNENHLSAIDNAVGLHWNTHRQGVVNEAMKKSAAMVKEKVENNELVKSVIQLLNLVQS